MSLGHLLLMALLWTPLLWTPLLWTQGDSYADLQLPPRPEVPDETDGHALLLALEPDLITMDQYWDAQVALEIPEEYPEFDLDRLLERFEGLETRLDAVLAAPHFVQSRNRIVETEVPYPAFPAKETRLTERWLRLRIIQADRTGQLGRFLADARRLRRLGGRWFESPRSLIGYLLGYACHLFYQDGVAWLVGHPEADKAVIRAALEDLRSGPLTRASLVPAYQGEFKSLREVFDNLDETVAKEMGIDVAELGGLEENFDRDRSVERLASFFRKILATVDSKQPLELVRPELLEPKQAAVQGNLVGESALAILLPTLATPHAKHGVLERRRAELDVALRIRLHQLEHGSLPDDLSGFEVPSGLAKKYSKAERRFGVPGEDDGPSHFAVGQAKERTPVLQVHLTTSYR